MNGINRENLRVLSVEEQAAIEREWEMSPAKKVLDFKRKILEEKIADKSFAAYSRRA